MGIPCFLIGHDSSKLFLSLLSGNDEKNPGVFPSHLLRKVLVYLPTQLGDF